MVLVIALIVLVAVTIAGIGMMRSVDTATLVAGNLAFQQAATRAADKGIEEAVGKIKDRVDANLSHQDEGTVNYFATLTADDTPGPAKTWKTWQDLWKNRYAGVVTPMTTDQFGNQVSYVIHRMCGIAAPAGGGGQCVESPRVAQATGGNSNDGNDIPITGSSQTYYRITVRVLGPRRTESFVQAHVAK